MMWWILALSALCCAHNPLVDNFDNARLLYNAGMQKVMSGDIEQGYRYFERALKNKDQLSVPDQQKLLYNVGNAQAQLTLYQSALETFEDLYKQVPDKIIEEKINYLKQMLQQEQQKSQSEEGDQKSDSSQDERESNADQQQNKTNKGSQQQESSGQDEDKQSQDAQQPNDCKADSEKAAQDFKKQSNHKSEQCNTDDTQSEEKQKPDQQHHKNPLKNRSQSVSAQNSSKSENDPSQKLIEAVLAHEQSSAKELMKCQTKGLEGLLHQKNW